MCMADSRVSESNDIFMTYKVVQNDGMDVGFVFKQKNIQICNGFVTAGRSGSNWAKKDVSFWTGRRLQKCWNFEFFFQKSKANIHGFHMHHFIGHIYKIWPTRESVSADHRKKGQFPGSPSEKG